jgi:hypothetical protein
MLPQETWGTNEKGSQPSAEWVSTFWRWVGSRRGSMELFTEWPLLPVCGGRLHRLETVSRVVQPGSLAEADWTQHMVAALESLDCRVVDQHALALTPAEQPTGLSAYTHAGTAAGVLLALWSVLSRGGAAHGSDIFAAERVERVLKSAPADIEALLARAGATVGVRSKRRES